MVVFVPSETVLGGFIADRCSFELGFEGAQFFFFGVEVERAGFGKGLLGDGTALLDSLLEEIDCVGDVRDFGDLLGWLRLHRDATGEDWRNGINRLLDLSQCLSYLVEVRRCRHPLRLAWASMLGCVGDVRALVGILRWPWVFGNAHQQSLLGCDLVISVATNMIGEASI